MADEPVEIGVESAETERHREMKKLRKTCEDLNEKVEALTGESQVLRHSMEVLTETFSEMAEKLISALAKSVTEARALRNMMANESTPAVKELTAALSNKV